MPPGLGLKSSQKDETHPGLARSAFSAVHQYEDSPAEVLALVSDMAGRCGVEFSSHFAGEFVVGIGVKPAPDIEPLGGLVAIPAVWVGEDQLHNITTPPIHVAPTHEAMPAGSSAT